MPVVLLALAVVAFTAALAYVGYRLDIEQEHARIASRSSLADTACGPIEYAVRGEGPPVLLVHGAGGGFDQGMDIARELAADGFRTIAMSRFGYLRTPLPVDASPAAQADAHACLLDALGVARAAIVGISAGAPSSMQFALRHPQRTTALVLLVPLAYAPRPMAASPPSALSRVMIEHAVKSDALFWVAMKVAPSLITRTILATPPEVLERSKPEEQARVEIVMRHILPLSARQAGLLNDAVVAGSLPRYELERIAVPALVISVADDLYGTFASARYTAEHIPGARFLGYESGGHLWVGHHQDIRSQMTSFLSRSSTVPSPQP